MTKRRQKRRGTTTRSGERVEPRRETDSQGVVSGSIGSSEEAAPPAGRRARRPAPLRSTPRRAVAKEEEPAREREEVVPHPPMPHSMARGLAAVGRSPALLASGFVAVLGYWAAFFAYATLLSAVPPALMVLFESLPPLHSLVVDVQLLASGRTIPAGGALAFAFAVVVYRALFSTFWISLMLEELEPGNEVDGSGPSSLRRATNRAVRRFPAMLGVELGFLTLALVSLFVAGTFLGAGLGQLGVMAALIGGTYFFVYAPVVAVVEGASPRSAIRLAIRAARVPGPRHLVFTVGYIAMALLVSQLAPTSRLAQATPPIEVWAYVLFVTFLHLSAQAALVYRWLTVRGPILEREGQAVPRRTRGR